MMIGVWWRKVLRDLLNNKIRTMLVVLSIAVGVFAIGMVAGTYEIILRDLSSSYKAVNPAMATIYSSSFKEEFLESIRKVKGVSGAQGQRTLSMRVKVGPDKWQKLEMAVIPDYKDIHINKLKLISGSWPPPEKQMLIERSGLSDIKANVGDEVEVESPDGKKRSLRIAGVVHDINQNPTAFSGRIYGYITLETLEALGLKWELDTVNITVNGDPPSEEYIAQVGQKVWDKIEKSGRKVFWMYKNKPGEHPAQSMIDALLMTLGAMGILSLILSGFLLVNTISSLLTQQVRQIGVMKAIGASTKQIIKMYLMYVIIYSLLALMIAVPLGILAAGAVSKFIASYINFDISGLAISYPVLAAEVATGLLIPLLAAIFPVVRGARITVREAMNSYGVGSAGGFGTGMIDRITRRMKGVSRPVLLSLRNTFRRKGRLALTLITLTVSGVIFISIFSVRDSMMLTLDDALDYFKYDIEIDVKNWSRVEQLEQTAMNVPGVSKAESWSFDGARLMKSDGRESESTEIVIMAPPSGTKMLKPIVLQGRWLVPEDESGIVINTEVLKDHPNVKVGDRLAIKLSKSDKHKTYWTVVGIVRGVMAGPFVYANYSYFSNVVGKPGQGINVFAVTESRDPDAQMQIAKTLEKHFKDSGMPVSRIQTMSDLKVQIQSQFNVIIIFLLVMALMLAIVGGLGLMGTMSINVLERTREIGIMRSIGASNWAVRRIFIIEGVLIGILSWGLAMIIALPTSKLFSNMLGNAFMNAPFSFTFSIGGAILWLIIVIVLAAVASFLPAWNASRLSIREVLAYE
ncbi:FtsX-like permease family protein [Pelosinus propionicus]|uniref:Putative ABC transport system permease protein n=1 Tax=Pelosinus propionicus DSM 13327 TaxID=1123291 RepID=A0A1I4ISR7_9FIRM|nr:FtsX-like permease family protein [Pelosinus propionicus]SFL57344.1 putative ABC transport system permease protein [Pelosinus propionicus DSM 13327]